MASMSGTSGTNRDMSLYVPGIERDKPGHTLKGVPLSRCLSRPDGKKETATNVPTIAEELADLEAALLAEVDADRQKRIALMIESRRLELAAEVGHAP